MFAFREEKQSKKSKNEKQHKTQSKNKTTDPNEDDRNVCMAWSLTYDFGPLLTLWCPQDSVQLFYNSNFTFELMVDISNT